MILTSQLSEYMEEGTLNNFLQEGLFLSIGYVDEPFVAQPMFLAPGEKQFVPFSEKLAQQIQTKIFEYCLLV